MMGNDRYLKDFNQLLLKIDRSYFNKQLNN